MNIFLTDAVKRKMTCVSLSFLVWFSLLSMLASAENQGKDSRVPDSEYFEQGQSLEKEKNGGFFDFLPFVGSRPKRITPEKLSPSPKPKRSRPVLSRKNLEELQVAADSWLSSSEFTEPTLRQDEEGGYYRDYIVFAIEYRAEIVRGDSADKPFIGHIYVRGDYFKTKSHYTPDAARTDFRFKYKPQEFRVVFDRVEKWEYSDNPNEEPFAFIGRWKFNNLQSRLALDSEGTDWFSNPSSAAKDDESESSQPETTDIEQEHFPDQTPE